MTRKKKNLMILGVVLVLGIVALIFVLSSKNKTFEQDFHIEDTASVTKIFLANKLDQSVLLSKKDGKWYVDEKFEGNQPNIKMLLGTLHDMVLRNPIPLVAQNNTLKDLSGSNTKIEVYQRAYTIDLFGKIKLLPKEKLTKTIYVGRETQDNQGTIMLLKGEEKAAVVHIPGFRGFLTPRFSANPRSWRSQEIFNTNVHAIQSAKVEVPNNPAESFEVVKVPGNSFDFKLLSTGQRLNSFDSVHVSNFLASFANANFDQIAVNVPKEEAEPIFSAGPLYVVTLTDINGKSKWLKAFAKMENPHSHASKIPGKDMYDMLDVNRMYALTEGIPDTLLIQYFVFDNMLKPASYFMNNKIKK